MCQVGSKHYRWAGVEEFCCWCPEQNGASHWLCLRAGEGSAEGLGVPEKASKIWRCGCSPSVEITKSYLVIMVLTLFFLHPPKKRAFLGGWRGATLALPKTCPFSCFILFFSERVISSCCPFLFPEILPGLDEQGTHCWDVWYFHH